MAVIKQDVLTIVSVTGAAIVLYLMCVGGPYARYSSVQLRRQPLILASNVPRPSRILYLMQTEECLPAHLRSAGSLGNTHRCGCDVAILSYKEVCTDTFLAHVRYIFNSSTSWTTGRNLLYETFVRNSEKPYLYYVMMDDDVNIRWANESKNPWRSFEEFLRRVQPAVVGADEPANNKSCATNTEYNPTVWYDACFNAFHYKAVHHLLPYWSEMDNINWWLSQVYLIVWGELLFPGQVVFHKELIVENAQHRPYPRQDGVNAFLPTIPKILADIRKRIPEECRDTPILKAWERKGVEHGRYKSLSYCMPPPRPKQPICPFICDTGNFQRPPAYICR